MQPRCPREERRYRSVRTKTASFDSFQASEPRIGRCAPSTLTTSCLGARTPFRTVVLFSQALQMLLQSRMTKSRFHSLNGPLECAEQPSVRGKRLAPAAAKAGSSNVPVRERFLSLIRPLNCLSAPPLWSRDPFFGAVCDKALHGALEGCPHAYQLSIFVFPSRHGRSRFRTVLEEALHENAEQC